MVGSKQNMQNTPVKVFFLIETFFGQHNVFRAVESKLN